MDDFRTQLYSALGIQPPGINQESDVLKRGVQMYSSEGWMDFCSEWSRVCRELKEKIRGKRR